MGRGKSDNVASLKRHKEVIEFSLERDLGVSHRWVCSCGTKGHWYNRAKRRAAMFQLWQGHLTRCHPQHSTDLEDLDKEAEGL